MKLLSLSCLAALGLLASCSLTVGHSGAADEQKEEVDLVHVIQGCSRIYSTEFDVCKIIIQTDEMRMKGKVLGFNVNMPIAGGKRVIAIPIKGVLKGYVDMADFKPENLIRRGDSIEVRLPDPKIALTSTKISAADIQEQVGLLQSKFSDVDLTRIQQQGRDSLIANIPEIGLIPNVRLSAARTIIALLTSLGYDESKITVTFNRDERRMADISNIKDMIVTSLN